ncbi:hypothetical protein ACFE04_009475 [Oxalis oulophora]
MAFSNNKAATFWCVVLISLFIGITGARDFVVGGKTNAWKIPTSESDSLNKWAAALRFQVGDSLVWNYDSNKDSVLQVTKASYETCNTTDPLVLHKDGSTKVKLEKSGPYYFISGAKGHCEQGEKLVVVVLSQKGKSTSISPAPSPDVEFGGPAMAPKMMNSGVSLRVGFVVVLGCLMGLVLV